MLIMHVKAVAIVFVFIKVKIITHAGQKFKKILV